MSGGEFDRTSNRDGGRAFRIIRTPTDAHHSSGSVSVLSRAELDRPSCPACYRPMLPPAPAYCPRCVATGAATRHRHNRLAGW